MNTNQLDQEMKTYEANKDDLLARAKGKFVLIKGDKILGIFESQVDAVNQGYKELGLVPFLVKEVQELETPIHFYSRKIVL
jgi:hypothetical protein